jgi:ESS family glutamate:Na+ symporter
MDFSAANTALWDAIIQFGAIAAAILAANILRRRLAFVRDSLMPTAVLAGFIILILRSLGLFAMNLNVLEMITYHGIALGFVAMSLRVNRPTSDRAGVKSGALIVGAYLIQGVAGLAITITLGCTLMPDLFKAAGILLPMGFGQGPGQANNVGAAYEVLGFAGGRSFSLSIAASGYLVACVVGVVVLNVLVRRGEIRRVVHAETSGSVTVDAFQDKGEIPISESLDKFSVQAALVLFVYLLTYLVTRGLTAGVSAVSPAAGETVNPLLWGFNFIIGSALGILACAVMKRLRRANHMRRQYQNNYLLSRISGFCFDVMIVAGIASIEISALEKLWLPFFLMSVAGAAGTWLYLSKLCRKIYPGYYYEGLMSMYGMLTGTISSGILLLREIDPDYETPAANNLVLGSGFGIVFGAPVLLLIGLAPRSDLLCFATLGLCAAYFAILMVFVYRFGMGRAGKQDDYRPN